MSVLKPPEVEENFKLATALCDKTIKTLQEDQKLKHDDSRVVFFRKMSQINDTSIISYSLYRDYLLTHVWWDEKFPNHIISNKNKNNLCYSYDQHIRTAFMIESFSALESSLRVIIQAYNSKEYIKKQRSFNALAEWFMKEMGLKDLYPVIQVFTYLRNSVHSNGLFSPFDQKNKTIQYQDKKFLFEVGKFIEYGGWIDLFSMTKVAIMNFGQIVENSKIKSMGYIKEPASHVW